MVSFYHAVFLVETVQPSNHGQQITLPHSRDTYTALLPPPSRLQFWSIFIKKDDANFAQRDLNRGLLEFFLI